jgi:hypothetical protein
MPKDKIYIEEHRLCEESYCKHLKRLIVGLVRYSEQVNKNTDIPEHFFDDVPDNIGFSFSSNILDNGESVRTFSLISDWELGKNDCGGSEYPYPGDVEISLIKPKKNIVHLKIVPALNAVVGEIIDAK